MLLFMGIINTCGQYARKKFYEKCNQSHVSTRIFHPTTWLNDWKNKKCMRLTIEYRGYYHQYCSSPEEIITRIVIMDHQIRRGRRLWKISKKMWNVIVILKCTMSIISESSSLIEKIRPDWLKYNIVCRDTYNFGFWSTIRSSPEDRKKQRRVWNIFNVEYYNLSLKI